MKKHVRSALFLAACLMVLGLMVFAVACGDSDEATTTTAAAATATTVAAAPDTTEAATATTAGAATDTTAGAAAATSGTMAVKGMVDKPAKLAVADLKAMTVKTITAEHPKKGATEYTGVLLSDIMASVGVQSGAKTLVMGATDGYMGQVTLAELDANAMIAIGDDGTLNAVMPGQSGKAWVSDIISLDFQ
jgi:hypothetical protein